ncbi:MAG TPA: glutamate racemase [Daejeonella sp.]|nr:glutamate racemase [Daejeonella sp.]
MSSALPIGIFDSGIGGLTVAGAIHRILPEEQLIYFGDTAHLPYGDKSPEAIKGYSLNIGRFLLSQKCKMIVIACNTASSHGYQALVDDIGGQVPVISVIDPVIQELVRGSKHHRVGVIGTKSTIQSGIYASKIAAIDPGIKVFSLATPLLAPMIEEGYFNNNISHTVIQEYLSSPKLKDIDSLVLACTHYPLIKQEIFDHYDGKVDIINTAEIVAKYVKDELDRMELRNTSAHEGHRFYVSDYTKSFEKSTRLFFGEKINLQLQLI